MSTKYIRIYRPPFYPFPDFDYDIFAEGVITVYFKFHPYYWDVYPNWDSGIWSHANPATTYV